MIHCLNLFLIFLKFDQRKNSNHKIRKWIHFKKKKGSYILKLDLPQLEPYSIILWAIFFYNNSFSLYCNSSPENSISWAQPLEIWDHNWEEYQKTIWKYPNHVFWCLMQLPRSKILLKKRVIKMLNFSFLKKNWI